MFRVAINGFGRIGRNILRAYYENISSGKELPFKIVSINDLGNASVNAHLLKYDTAHGTFSEEISVDGDDLVINNDRIKVTAERDPNLLPWAEMNIDIVSLSITATFFRRITGSWVGKSIMCRKK